MLENNFIEFIEYIDPLNRSTQIKARIKAIAVTNSQKVACSPCGACRQVIWEFGQDVEVIFLGNQGWQHSTIKELLPVGFVL